MKKHSSNRAILILESPWELDSSDSNRSSVFPFVDGVSKYSGDIEVYHANFYDKNSFEKALKCLCKTKFKSTIVYIAAHGYKRKICDVSLNDVLFRIGDMSKPYNITGVMLGSCFVGEHTTTMEVYIEGTNIKWCAGYSNTTKWLEGTLIDCSILAKMSDLDIEDFGKRENFIIQLAKAIAPFSNDFEIGKDYNEEPVRLADSMQFVVQPVGKGNRAITNTIEVFSERDNLQL